MELYEDVAPTDELPLDVHLGDGLPATMLRKGRPEFLE
jgi:hypothetical protein